MLVLGIFSDWLKREGVSNRLVALLVGVGLGPVGVGVLDPAHWGEQHLILEEVARLTLGVGLMGVALRIPWKFMKSNWRSVLTVVVGAMVGMWALSSLAAALGLALWPALLLGAVVTPTDPIAASSVVNRRGAPGADGDAAGSSRARAPPVTRLRFHRRLMQRSIAKCGT